MSIFDNIKLPKNSQLDLLIQLKYGPIRHDDSFIDALPESAVKFAYNEVCPLVHLRRIHASSVPIELQRQTLSIMLRQPANIGKATQAIKRALTLYHSMIG